MSDPTPSEALQELINGLHDGNPAIEIAARKYIEYAASEGDRNVIAAMLRGLKQANDQQEPTDAAG